MAINLNSLFVNSPTVELIEPREATSRYLRRPIRWLILDGDSAIELTISPDMLAMPDEAIMVWSATQLEPPPFSRDHGEFVDDGQSPIVDEVEPDFGWRVAMDGTETDTRLVEGGLF